MKNKTLKKVYTIMIIALLVIALSTSVSLYKNNKNIEILDVYSDNNTDDIDDFVNSDNNDSNSENNEQTEVEAPKTYSSSQGYACYKDAMEYFENCDGYEVQLNTVCQTLGEYQWIDDTLIKSGNYYYRSNTAYTTMPSLGKTFFRYFYSNDGFNNIEYKRTNKINDDKTPDWSGLCDEKTINPETYYYDYGYTKETFAILPTSKTELVSFDRVTNKNFYIIKFMINNIPTVYIDNIKKEGNLDYVNLSSINMTFYIEKSTLYLRKAEKVEVYKGKKIIEFTCTAKQTAIVKQINKRLVPEKPII